MDELKAMDIVHGDIHADNICLKPKKPENAPVIPSVSSKTLQDTEYQVVLIDFGWCLHRSFVMEEDERRFYEECLSTDWDRQHFEDSMSYMFED